MADVKALWATLERFEGRLERIERQLGINLDPAEGVEEDVEPETSVWVALQRLEGRIDALVVDEDGMDKEET